MQNAFYNVFVDILRDTLDAENQIVSSLPKVIGAASHQELKQALSDHLTETKTQVQRLHKIFNLLNENPKGKHCQAMKGLLAEADETIARNDPANVKDAYLIVCCQKVEHYEISGYGSLCSIAHHLNHVETQSNADFDEIADILQQTLDEEGAADDKLTSIAEGGFFSRGINDEAEEDATANS